MFSCGICLSFQPLQHISHTLINNQHTAQLALAANCHVEQCKDARDEHFKGRLGVGNVKQSLKSFLPCMVAFAQACATLAVTNP